ncbi:hypothetical protein LOZ53_002859 [Ophidiomyces ophidiicola]|uniref:Uncharacterized protein n=1 Tax=Ophidiomyces ophidiicola TaxID=1387563 RepID=A0ACB8UNH2_9EURO|nr:uncharacterized protein LOZ57_003966 [Ophidiomyces ophidiicola]KAI1916665.1 hypothetical protein LOZ61_000934 [Ophidiomyces ophidiicola]KAI1918406.1 hypothetical protein LOZ64_002811 [Ophidiomyces ophidiicola]KAI1920195.1 hypothetical protein LOZ60_006625 [Ophidiomyces ophidiicola]KAI1945716.1 hypothetical protein LOZ57_003966 [Ophidiomyces ophidiicola]KAI1950635.1 hypothetical protein LOZ62_001899 [Ophidiomyces ophidiicola]
MILGGEPALDLTPLTAALSHISPRSTAPFPLQPTLGYSVFRRKCRPATPSRLLEVLRLAHEAVRVLTVVHDQFRRDTRQLLARAHVLELLDRHYGRLRRELAASALDTMGIVSAAGHSQGLGVGARVEAHILPELQAETDKKGGIVTGAIRGAQVHRGEARK